MRKISPALLTLWMIVCAVISNAQVIQNTIIVNPAVTVNFQQQADYEALHPLPLEERVIEQGEDRDEDFEFIPQPVTPGAPQFDVVLPMGGSRSTSPAPTITFNGTMDNGTLIPPDIRGAVGPNHVMETTNQEYKIFTKAGTLVSTVSITTFFSITQGSDYFDPHILYDPTNSRWLLCSAGTHSSGNGGIFVAVSQTNNPTGNWYVYSFDGLGNSYDFLDYPLMGYNSNWVVITGNDFLSSGSVIGKIYTMNRASLYAGTLANLTVFTDANVFTMAPAQTYDISQTTLYMVQNWNGNYNGYGYVRISRITGTPSAPVYSTGSLLSVNQPWSDTRRAAPQSGSSRTLEAGDTRIGNAVYRNGSLWFCQNAFLPASSPSRIAAQWWQVNPAAPSVQQFGRVDGGSSAGMFYFYPSIAVNASNHVMLGHCQSSTSSFPSASYSVRAGTDPVNSMQSPYAYKTGLASYYKIGSGGRNRWGDYTGAFVDPSDNSFWNFSEWANTSNRWGTVITNVVVPNPVVCNTPASLASSPVGNSYATLSWGAVSGATSYRVQYRATGASIWTTVTTINTNYTATGLIQGTPYQWQVQAICSGGTSTYTSILSFTTTGTAPCNIPSSLSTFSITTSTATLSWAAVTGAVSYNLRIRVLGSTTWINRTSATNSYAAIGLVSNTTYEWQVQTLCANATSAFSSSITFTTLIVCNAPTSLTTNSVTGSTAIFSWIAVAGAINYNVRYRAVGSGAWLNGLSTTNSYNAVGLISGTSYEWQVQTVCSGTATSAFTSSITFLTTGVAPCNIPTSLSTSLITTTTARLNWAAVPGASWYNPRYRAVGTTTWNYLTTTTAVNYYDVTGLSPGTAYEWQVYTVCSGSPPSAYSSSLTFTTLSPCATTNTWWVSSIGSTTGTLNWSNATGAISYNVRYRPIGAATWSAANCIPNYYQMTGLIPGTQYEWQVQTVCSNGVSAYNSLSNFSTSYTTSCTLPTSLGASSITSNSASLTWNIGGGATGHNIRYRPLTSFTWTTATAMSGYNVYFATGLMPATEYIWQVQTICSRGASAYITAPTFMTTGSSCSVPVGLATTSITYNSATLSWTPVSGATGYYYRGRVNGTSNWSYYYTQSATGNIPINIFPGATYIWNVQTVCPAGRSSFSTSYTFTTPGIAPCGLPEPLVTTNITPTSALLKWNAVSGALGYYWGYRLVGTTAWTEDTVTTNAINLMGLSPNTDYEWFSQVVCPTGASAYIPSLLFTTAPLPPCSDNFESNNTSATAYQATTSTSFTGRITPSTDVDWFKFTTTLPYTNLEIDLTGVPADYDVQLYASNGTTVLATSQNRGTASEQIKYPTTSASTYYLKIYGYGGANSASLCYTVQLAASSLAYSPISLVDETRSVTGIDDSVEIQSAMKLFPNPANNELTVDFISDNGGKTILNVYTLTGQKVIAIPVVAVEGLNTRTINTSTLSDGIYMFEVKGNEATQRVKFTISN